MAEFLTMQEAEDKFGKKGKTNAALTLGIIGTALGASSYSYSISIIMYYELIWSTFRY